MFGVSSAHAVLSRAASFNIVEPLRQLLGRPPRPPLSEDAEAAERLERLRVTIIGRVLLILYVCYAGVCQKVRGSCSSS